jgi:hypothetical protein
VQLTRRKLLEMTALMVVAPKADLVERRAADVIRGYSDEGEHRTATAVDRASANAVLARARAAGATPLLEPFELSRIDPVAAFAEIDGRRIDGLPMFDGPFTGAGGVTGRIGPIGSDTPIAWTRIAPNGEAELRRMRDGSKHAGIVAVTVGGKTGLCPVNAGWFTEPFGPPVLQVSSEQLSAIDAAATQNRELHLVTDVTRSRVSAVNVLALVRGTDPSLPPVCVMTPRSGWHANASERGGGLVCWLETLRAVAAAKSSKAGRGPLRTVRFIASSGHELGHLGLKDYLRRNPTLARDAYAWVHFGANIGASTGDTGITPSDDWLRDAALRALEPHGLGKIRQSPASQVAGEAATIKEQDGHFVSFIGRNDWFHNPRDVWPDVVDLKAIAAFARASADLTLALANQG